MNKKRFDRNLGVIAGAGVMLAVLPQANAGGNPFELPGLGATAVVVAAGEKGISVLEGKCGSGKCGTQRIRTMMDVNSDGMIDRDEYVSWSADVAQREYDRLHDREKYVSWSKSMANQEFDEIAKGEPEIGADKVYEHYRSLEFHTKG